MPKLTLTFDTEVEAEAGKRAVFALELALALSDIGGYLRHRDKYAELSSEASEEIDKARTRYYEILESYGVSEILESL